MSAIIYALTANAGIAASKAAAAVYTGSTAMMAEAVHSGADCANQLLLLFGLKQSRRPPSPQHPLGYGKATYFWSFMVAVMLFTLGGAFSMYEGIHKLMHPEPLHDPWIAIIVLSVGIVLEAWSLRGCIHEIHEKAGKVSLISYFRESRESELIVVMGEDIAALAGLALALIAILLAILTGNPIFDALGSVGVGALLIIVAIGVGAQVKSLLVGESAAPEREQAISHWLAARPEIAEMYSLITYQMGSYIFVAAKARMAESESARRLTDAINAVQDGLKQSFPEIRWIFFEPDDKRDNR